MSASFSLVLPVRDAQHALRGHVISLLEVALSVAPRFELLVIDRGSQDQTMEVASALTREYPQVAVLRQTDNEGAAGIQRLALQQTRGQVLLIHDGSEWVSPEEWVTLYRSPLVCHSRAGERVTLGSWCAVGRGPLPSSPAESAVTPSERAIVPALEPMATYLSRIQAWAW